MSARADFRFLAAFSVTDDVAANEAARALDEIDHLRLREAWLEQIAVDRGVENERLRQRYIYPQSK